MITVALDKSADAARPWIEAARPTHPALIDTRHVLADLYNVVNVPTIFWIDERLRIVAPTTSPSARTPSSTSPACPPRSISARCGPG